MRRILLPALLSAALLSGCAGGETPATSSASAGAPVTVTVPDGATGSDVATILERAGVTSRRDFYQLAVSDSRSTSIRPGQYQLATGMSAAAALEALLDPHARVSKTLEVRAGTPARDLVEDLAAATGASAQDAAAALRLNGGVSELDGGLGVAVYDILPGDTAASVVKKMWAAGAQVRDRAAALASTGGHSAGELLTIASLLQAEALPGDWGKAARVIENRLEAGMRLQLDSTAAYAAGVKRLDLTADELKTPSPYNTYVTDGLPAGAIGQVTEAALEAAAAPEPGSWLYWVTVNPDTGETRFSTSYEEFLKDKSAYRDWQASGR